LSWSQVAERVCQRPGVVMIVGPVDSGKSSLTCYLARTLVQAGVPTAVVDADVGQSDIGPPACIGMGMAEKPPQTLGDIRPSALYFVGDVSPDGYLVDMALGTQAMVRRAQAAGAKAVVVDTTGSVYGPAARRLKEATVEAIGADYLVVIGDEGSLGHLLAAWRGRTKPEVWLVKRPAEARVRSRVERRNKRALDFSRYFEAGGPAEVAWEELWMKGGFLGAGRRLEDAERRRCEELLQCPVLHGERFSGSVWLVVEGFFSKQGLDQVKREMSVAYVGLVRASAFHGLLVGLGDANGQTVGLGIVEAVAWHERRLTLWAVPAGYRPQGLCLGRVRISRTGEELGRLSPGDLGGAGA